MFHSKYLLNCNNYTHKVQSLWEVIQYFYPDYLHKHAELNVHSFIHSFVYSDYFYSASSSLLLLRGAPDTARILCRCFMPKRHGLLRVKDLPKVPTWRPERDSNPQPIADFHVRHFPNDDYIRMFRSLKNNKIVNKIVCYVWTNNHYYYWSVVVNSLKGLNFVVSRFLIKFHQIRSSRSRLKRKRINSLICSKK